jgi:hypothetical protein
MTSWKPICSRVIDLELTNACFDVVISRRGHAR